MRFISRVIAGLALAAFVGGCANYYKVTDLATHKEYYTSELRQDHGATILRDGKTGNQVTVQSSEVKQISKEEYDIGRFR